jgi:pimeloyl-ACP methyl ester carboxylesterase
MTSLFSHPIFITISEMEYQDSRLVEDYYARGQRDSYRNLQTRSHPEDKDEESYPESFTRDRSLFLVALFFAVVLLAIILFGRWLNYRVLFQPKQEMIWHPEKETYKDIYIRMGDRQGKPFAKYERKEKYDYINVWHFEPFDNVPSQKVVLYCHGNNDNNSYRDYVVDICKKFHLNLLLIDYRGYGNSDGHPTSDGVVEDAICAYAYLRRHCEPEQIVIWGESLGGSAAIRVAAEKPCCRLVLLATFASLPDIFSASEMNKYARNTIATMTDFIWDNINSKYWISKIKCPIAIVHSSEDELIPYPNSKILYDSICHSDKIHITVKGVHARPIMTKYNLLELHSFLHAGDDSDECSNTHLSNRRSEISLEIPNSSDLEEIMSRILEYK